MTNLDTRADIAARSGSAPGTPPIRATVFVGRWPNVPVIEMPGLPVGQFSPTTATLVSGPTEIVLIDALYLKDDVRDLGDLIERTGKRLTTIYVTHAHQDHYLGIGPLLERFPEARAVALPHVIEAMKESMDLQSMQWQLLFGDTCIKAGALPDPLEGRTLYVDGSPLNIIEIKQADIHPTTIVHIPDIDVVVAGDSIYNEIFPMLGLSTPDEWPDWIEAVDVVESLQPKVIVAGHRRPDGDDHAVDTMIAETRAYLLDYAAAFEVAKDADELVAIMTDKYPHHGNLWTLEFSAMSSMQHRLTGTTAVDVGR
jgi:glyoxylase-like metal-dependent hydrolase (beta-lactamase superfamily II)